VAILAIAIMYYIVGRVFTSNTVIATYSSVRDATDGCIRYGVSLLLQGTFDDELQMPGDCVGPYTISYRIRNVGEYQSKLTICLSDYSLTDTSFANAGATERPTMVSAGGYLEKRGNVYTVLCETTGELKPNNPNTPTIYSRLETIYIP